MKLIEVNDRRTSGEFLKLPRIIYSGDPFWIPHLDNDVEAVFDPLKNPLFRSGELKRWILKDNAGNLIGRVAAFVNGLTAHTGKLSAGGMGFFECIDNREAAFALFERCSEWCRSKGMDVMDGPINFGDKERFWGLLSDGFGTPPPYLINYNPPYYRELFEQYGFANYYEQYIYSIEAGIALPPIVEKKFERLTQTQGYHFEHMKLANLEKYTGDFMTIYNQAWSDAHQNFHPLGKDQALEIFARMKSVIDEELIVFAYHHGKPVAFFVGIPELNQILRYVDGKMDLKGKLKFLYHRWRGKCRVIYGMVFGIIPGYQNRGLESGLIMSIKQIVSKNNFYDSMLITWIGDFNPKMIKIVEHIGAKRIFTLVTYRKPLQQGIVFERHPVIGH